jgi:hypothetical protein
MKTRNHIIVNLMIEASKKVLIKKIEEWLAKKHPQKTICFRAGSGKSTHHKKLSKHQHEITYGVKMVENKISSMRSCSRWTTGKEIISRKYYNGEVTIQHALAHTVVHECAHFIQVLGEFRDYGSVHNDKFYEILDRMHASGIADDVLAYLNKFETFRNLEFIDQDTPITSIYNNKNIRKGYVVSFKSRDGSIIQDIVVKANPKKVQCSRYTLPYSIITHVEKDISNVDPNLIPKMPQYNNTNVKKGNMIYFKDGNGNTLNDTVIRVNPKRVQCSMYVVPYGLIIDLK